MTQNSSLTTKLLFALIVAGSITALPECNTSAISKVLTGEGLDVKEAVKEASFEAFVPEASVKTTGFVASGICGQLWTQAGGTCCNQAKIQARADKLVEKTQAKLQKRYDMVNKGREKLIKNLDKLKEKITALKGKEPVPAAGGKRMLKANELTKREKFEKFEGEIDKLKALNPDDDKLNEEVKQKMATCLQTMIETRVKIWCLACANKEVGKTLDTTNYFDANGVLVSRETCETLITNCGQVFAFSRRIREADKILRRAKGTMGETANAPNGTDSELPDNSEADLNGEKECTADITTCKSNQAKR